VLTCGSSSSSNRHRSSSSNNVASTPSIDDQVAVWRALWTRGDQASFHLPFVNPNLEAFQHLLAPGAPSPAPTQCEASSSGDAGAGAGSVAATAPRILVPLCGASRDLVHLARAGWDVVGLDCAAQAFTQLQEECPGLRLHQGPTLTCGSDAGGRAVFRVLPASLPVRAGGSPAVAGVWGWLVSG
jgi:hypothetical protein